MASELARQKAAQAWCTDRTEKTAMDVILAEAFANILDDVWSQPWLGNATTAQLIDEVRRRIELGGNLQYRTVDSE